MPALSTRHHLRRWPYLIGLIVVFVIAAGVIGSMSSRTGSGPDHAGGLLPASPTTGSVANGKPTGGEQRSTGRDSESASAAAPDTVSGNGVPAESGAQLGPDTKVVQTGSIDLQVPTPQVIAVTDRAAAIATANGGYVQERHSDAGSIHPTGSVTLRVPNSNFDAALTAARALGKVGTTQVAAKDVTASVIDLQARLDALNRTRTQFDAILAKATDIGDILSVQDRINTLQVQIEQLQGQQKVLDDQTTYATLTVTVSDAAVVAQPPRERSGLRKAWHDATHGFTSAAQRVVAGSGLAAFWLLVLAIVAAVAAAIRGAIRRRGNPVDAT